MGDPDSREKKESKSSKSSGGGGGSDDEGGGGSDEEGGSDDEAQQRKVRLGSGGCSVRLLSVTCCLFSGPSAFACVVCLISSTPPAPQHCSLSGPVCASLAV